MDSIDASIYWIVSGVLRHKQHPKDLLQVQEIQEIALTNLVFQPAEHNPPALLQTQQPLRLNPCIFGHKIPLLPGYCNIPHVNPTPKRPFNKIQTIPSVANIFPFVLFG
jgi:hypothetical protein